MSIVHMYGFDHLPDRRGITSAQLTADGFETLNAQWHTSFMRSDIAIIDDRKWLSISGVYVQGSSQIRRVLHLLNQSGGSARDIFKNPASVTKGVIGTRVRTATPTGHFLTASYVGGILIVDSVRYFDKVFQGLTGGEHYIEIEFDFVEKTIAFYLNGGLNETVEVATLTLDSIVQFGPSWTAYWSASYENAIYLTDIYVTYDNQDGEISGRLGPVVVKPLFVDSVSEPESWAFEDPENILTYNLNEGGTWEARTLIPRDLTELNVPGSTRLSCPSATNLTSLNNIVQKLDNSTTAQFAVTGTNVDVILTVDFINPRKVSGYALTFYDYLGYVVNNWEVQGKVSSDSEWVTLDSKLKVPILVSYGWSQYAYKLPEDKVGIYKHVRMRIFDHIFKGNGPTILSHFQLLGEPEDSLPGDSVNTISRTTNTRIDDLDFPVVKTDIVGGEATYGFKVPDVGPSDILAVDIGITARREQASSEHIVAKYQIDEEALDPVTVELLPHCTQPTYLGLLHKAVDGEAWTQDSLEKLRVIIKSKKGAK